MTEARTVLCVEDDDTLRMLLCEELEFAGYRVLQARDGAEGLEAIRQDAPDLVVCDVSMPRMNGFALLEAVNLNDEDPVPFIMLTALGDRLNQIRGRELGVVDYLVKPVDFDLLLAAVAARIKRRRHSDTYADAGGQFLSRQLLLERLEAARRVVAPVSVLLIKIDSYLGLSIRLTQGEQQQLRAEVYGRLLQLAESGKVYSWADGCWALIERGDTQGEAMPGSMQRHEILVGGVMVNYTLSMLRIQVDWTSPELRRLDASALVEACALHLNFMSAGNARRFIYLGIADYQALEAARYAERNLAEAIRRGELELVFQPRVDIASRRIVGAEALLRWPGAAIGALSPGFFVPAAERMGLAAELDRWVIDHIILAAAQMVASAPDTVLSFNLSGQSLGAGVPAYLSQCLARAHPGIAANLEIEVTETSMAHLTPEVEDAIARLRAMGTKLAVDDFGMGYASLAYLKRLRAEVIKIDRSFVTDIALQEIDAQIVEGLIGLARAMGCTVVAEGVENAGQADALQALGCRFAQGYHFHHPMPLNALLRLLEAT
jgi:EAL domain-containing protein (putative c-di-GMP-specific phosphodiesterase class I)/DNA-binding response OmpR family regulator